MFCNTIREKGYDAGIQMKDGWKWKNTWADAQSEGPAICGSKSKNHAKE
jgi:hypothetical protein